MRQIVYISTAVSTFQTTDLGPILHEARYSNLRAGVTGLLLFDGKRFLQALEGEVDGVRTTYERISRDKRHIKIKMLSDRDVRLREFGNWNMETGIWQQESATIAILQRALTIWRDLSHARKLNKFLKPFAQRNRVIWRHLVFDAETSDNGWYCSIKH